MNNRTGKIFGAILNLCIVVGGFEGLIAILNLNQPDLFFRTAFYVGLFYIFQIFLLYDLHLKSSENFKRAQIKHQAVGHKFFKTCKVISTALWYRCYHLRKWKFFRQWLNYLVLPGMIFWSSIAIFFVNFGIYRIQQIYVLLSSTALFLNYWYLKEIFSRGKEIVDRDIFVAMSVVKVYASAIIYGAIVVLVRRYCLDAHYLTLAIFCCTFLLIYQALYQHRLINIENLAITLAISIVMAFIGYGVLSFWGYNYFTAAVFMAACYNLLWAVFHYRLDKALTWAAFWEIFVVSVIICAMVFSVTNFRAKILDDCRYSFFGINGF